MEALIDHNRAPRRAEYTTPDFQSQLLLDGFIVPEEGSMINGIGTELLTSELRLFMLVSC